MHVPRNRSLRTLDFTYKLFLIAGLVTLLIFSAIALDPKNAEGWGMALGPIVGVGGFAALLVGIVRGFWCWRHRPLLLLALSPILPVIGGAIGDSAGNIALAIWAATMIMVPAWWFAKGKRQHQENLSLEEHTAQPASSFSQGPETRG
jgi:hypothetical protein